jgi:hypothetical protein
MSTQTIGSNELISASYSPMEKGENRAYTSLLESNGRSVFCQTLSCKLFRTVLLLILIPSSGSFGCTFWYDDNTNRARSDNNEETWSTAANASTVDESDVGQCANWSPGEDITAKRAERKA